MISKDLITRSRATTAIGELMPVDFAEVSPWQVVEKNHLPRVLVGFEPRLRERLQLSSQTRRDVARDDECTRLDQPIGVLDPDDRHLPHLLVLKEAIL